MLTARIAMLTHVRLLACILNLAASQMIQIDGSGTTNPSKFFWKIMESFQARSMKDIRLTYRAVGSSYGQAEFSQTSENSDYTQGLTDFGAGDIPMKKSIYDSMKDASREMVHVPFSLGAIAIFHSVPKEQLGSGGLKLSPCVLAKIFSGQITEWDHADIKAENEGMKIPAGTKIQVGHRTTGSSSTGGFTGYLDSKTKELSCAASWENQQVPMGEGSTVEWPELGTFTSVQGSPGMVEHIASMPYAIGYLDAGHGHQRNFEEVSLKNQENKWLTSKQAMAAVDANGENGIAAAGKAAVDDGNTIPPSVTDDWSEVNLYSKGGDNTWPIVLVSYIYLNTDWRGFPSDKAALLKAFVDYVTGEEGQGMLQEFSFNPIPKAMNTWSNTYATIIQKDVTVPFSFEENKSKWEGQAEYKISVKRNTYSMWKIDEMGLALADTQARLQALESSPFVTVDGSGTTNPSKFFWKIMESFQARSKDNIRLTYRAVGSSYGQAEFSQTSENSDYTQGLNDFGAGDIPMKKSIYDSMKDANRSMIHVPFCLGAIAIFHSVPKDKLGGEGLKLSPCVLAKIFSGQITEWDHAEIKADNPKLEVPAGTKIQVGHRTTGSSSTGGLTGYLDAKTGELGCSSSWVNQAGLTNMPMGSGSTVGWPDLETFTSVQGSPGMVDHIASQSYAIGYLDAGHGHQRSFAEVSLKNEADTWLTSKEAMEAVDANGENGIAAAGKQAVDDGRTIPSSVKDDWSDVNLYRKSGAMTWPIVLVSYIYLNTDWSSLSADKAGLLKAFVDYVTGKELGQKMLSEFSFNPLPEALNTWTVTWNDHIKKPLAVTDYAFEENKTKWGGQGQNMISVKRNSYSMWKIDEMGLALEDTQKRLAAVESNPTLMNPPVFVDGSGTTNPSKFFWKIMEMFQARSKDTMRLTYRAVGSSYGQAEFSQAKEGDYSSGLNDFGAGDIPMKYDIYASLAGASRKMIHVPFSLGAIGIFHSIPKEQLGGGMLKLSPCVLAKIFDGRITEWADAEITADNPGMKVPAGVKIQVGHRTTGSSSTFGTTGYLSAATSGKCGSYSWTRGSGSTIEWPQGIAFDNFHSVEGSPGMTAHIASNKYAIGYLDAGHGHQRKFGEVSLQNEDGKWLTSKEAMASSENPSENGIAKAGTAAVQDPNFPSDVLQDWSSVSLLNKGGEFTWPIVLVSYIYLNEDWSSLSADKAGLLKAFVDFVTGTEEGRGQQMLPEFSFNAIPSEMNKWSDSWDNVVIKPGGTTVSDDPNWPTKFEFEDETTKKQKWIGQGENVISVKRDSYSMWKLNEVSLALTDAENRLTAIESSPYIAVDGSGTTNPSKYFWKIMETFEARSRHALRLTYRAVGSSYGQAEFSQASEGDFTSSLTDFGAGDIPMDQALYNSISDKGRSMVHVPFCLGAIGIFHSVPQSNLADGSLKLSPCVLAKIFSGQITQWDDSEIMAENPGMTVPAGTKIQVGHRTTGSSSTGGTTGYLKAKCPSWDLGAGSKIEWPDLPTFTSVEGSPGMQSHIESTLYAIGYLDAGHGHSRNFGEVSLKNEADKWLTSKQAMAAVDANGENGIAAAGKAAVMAKDIPEDVKADWSEVNLYRKAGADTWPIVLVSYIYLHEDWSSLTADRAGLLKAFVDYVTGAKGQEMLSEFSFNSLPAAMNKWTDTWQNKIKQPSVVTDFTFEESKEKWLGQGKDKISVKRNSYSMWKIGELDRQVQSLSAGQSGSEDITTLKAQMAMMQSKVDELKAQMAALGPGPAPAATDDDDDADFSLLGLIAIILAVLSCCLSGFVTFRAISKSDGAGGGSNLSAQPYGNSQF